MYLTHLHVMPHTSMSLMSLPFISIAPYGKTSLARYVPAPIESSSSQPQVGNGPQFLANPTSRTNLLLGVWRLIDSQHGSICTYRFSIETCSSEKYSFQMK